MVSTPAGCDSVFTSEVSAATVTCAIMYPDCRRLFGLRNAGSPLSTG